MFGEKRKRRDDAFALLSTEEDRIDKLKARMGTLTVELTKRQDEEKKLTGERDTLREHCRQLAARADEVESLLSKERAIYEQSLSELQSLKAERDRMFKSVREHLVEIKSIGV